MSKAESWHYTAAKAILQLLMGSAGIDSELNDMDEDIRDEYAIAIAEIIRQCASTGTPSQVSEVPVRAGDFATRCQTAQECFWRGLPFRARLTALHNAMLAYIAELEAENERLRSDVTALLTGDFTHEDWERYGRAGA